MPRLTHHEINPEFHYPDKAQQNSIAIIFLMAAHSKTLLFSKKNNDLDVLKGEIRKGENPVTAAAALTKKLTDHYPVRWVKLVHAHRQLAGDLTASAAELNKYFFFEAIIEQPFKLNNGIWLRKAPSNVERLTGRFLDMHLNHLYSHWTKVNLNKSRGNYVFLDEPK